MEYELVICIVNAGFTSTVMEAARRIGAQGGTILHARGTAREDAEKKFNIAIHPEKDMVLIVVPKELSEKILHTLYEQVGLKTPGQGIAFTMPIDNTVGIGKGPLEKSLENA